MTLLETMVTVGIASGLMLAVMESVSLITKQVTSVQVSNDWSALVSNLRMLTQNNMQCMYNFQSLTFTPVWSSYPTSNSGTAAPMVYCASVANENPWSGLNPAKWPCNANNTALDKLSLFDPSGYRKASIIDTTAAIGGIRAVHISVSPVNGDQTQVIPYIVPGGTSGGVYVAGGPSGSLYLDTYELEIEASKVTATGAVMTGGTQRLYVGPGFSRSNSVQFTMVRNTAGVIQSCYSSGDQSQLACNDIGGILAYSGPSGTIEPHCQLESLELSRSNVGSSGGGAVTAVGPSAPGGQKLQLLRTAPWAAPSPSDFAIGIDSDTMWFNAGSSQAGKFQWYNNAGGSLQMSLANHIGPQTGGLLVAAGAVIADTATSMTSIPNTGPLGAKKPSAGTVMSTETGANYAFLQTDVGQNWFQGDMYIDGSVTIGAIGNSTAGRTLDGNVYQYYGMFGTEYIHNYPYQWYNDSFYEYHTSPYDIHQGNTETRYAYDFKVQNTYEGFYGGDEVISPLSGGYTNFKTTENRWGTMQFSGTSAALVLDSTVSSSWVLVARAGQWSVQSTVWFDGQVLIGNFGGFLNIYGGNGKGGNVPHNCTVQITPVTFPNSTTWMSATCSHGYALWGGCICNSGDLWINSPTSFGPDPRWWCGCNGNVTGTISQTCCDI